MKGGVIVIGAALVTYLAAIGCAVWPTVESSGNRATGSPAIEPEPARPASVARLDGMPFRGLVLQVQRIDSPEIYQKSIDEIAKLGADTVEIVVDSKQETVNSTFIYVDMRTAPSAEKLTALIQYAKSKGLRVVLMPILLLDAPKNNDWRGVIKPENWNAWFENYRAMIAHYATAAEAGHADVMMVGSELVSAEQYRDEWFTTIRETRQVFHGFLGYSANWDHYRTIPFWDHLDMICTNSYYKLGENRDVTVPQIVKRWQEIQADLIPWLRSQHKPYMFTEVGWCSLANAAHEPWDYTKENEPIDLDLQKKLYEGFFEAWNGKPELAGFMFWQWAPWGGGPRDRGYTPEGKPAEDVLRQWLAKPRWTVNVSP